jgi:hypothetical protein
MRWTVLCVGDECDASMGGYRPARLHDRTAVTSCVRMASHGLFLRRRRTEPAQLVGQITRLYGFLIPIH